MYSKILVALDGSDYSTAGGEIALAVAQNLGAEILAAHIYDIRIHSTRLQEMEPVLPAQYQEEEAVKLRRKTHKKLISEGFESLSKGYMEQFLNTAQQRGVCVSQVHRQGRNYVELLQIAEERKVNLIVVGAHGLGAVKDGFMGSTAMRTLRLATCDVLIARRGHVQGKTLVGIDGSEEAMGALRKATVWTRILGNSLELVAAYDPYFHNQVFNTMASSLSSERQQEINLTSQKVLHEQIIDGGLGELYKNFLDQAHQQCQRMNMQAETKLLAGKAYRAMVDYSDKVGAGLVIVGRYGHHRQNSSQIGSNSEAVARLSQASVLLTGPAAPVAQGTDQKTTALEWDDEALARLQRIPSFAQPMARQGIERLVSSKGRTKVTLQDFKEAAQSFGMSKFAEPDNK